VLALLAERVGLSSWIVRRVYREHGRPEAGVVAEAARALGLPEPEMKAAGPAGQPLLRPRRRVIPMTHDERMRGRLERALYRHKPEAWTVLGFVGVGYPGSLYKLYLRRGGGRWWHAERRLGHPLGNRPPEPQPHSETVRGDLRALAEVTCDPARPGLVWVLGQIRTVLGVEAAAG
jgi:hypothetical protein